MEKMKTRKTQPVNSIIEIEDEDFLSQVAAVEADVLSSKRRKLSAAAISADAEEGLYIAALRGSEICPPRATAVAKGRDNGVSVGGDSCFKCGKSGHWARDCVDSESGGGGRYTGNFGKDADVDDKSCPCGLGACLILTANTEKNRGRKFYKCPVREENGGCRFFEWCEVAARTKMTGGGNQSFVSDSLFPFIQCPCGAGSCLILTAKTEKNFGQQFYRCPRNQEDSCGFFKWCNEQTIGDGVSASPCKRNNSLGEKIKASYDLGSRSACFKCGKEGHWARDCSMASSNAPAAGQRSAPSNTCYKCNKVGHWAKDCSSSQYLNPQRKY